MRSRRNAGFSLIELFVTIGIATILIAIALPIFSNMFRENDLHRITRALVSDLRRARGLAATGAEITPGVRVRQAGIRVDTQWRYAVFVDPDEDPANLNEVDVQTIDFVGADPHGYVQITSPAPGSQIRFTNDGRTAAATIVLGDPERQRQRTIELTAGGQVRTD